MKYFKIEEFDCQETGNNEMDGLFLEMLDKLRAKCGFPFTITSGYRDPKHSIEAKKERPGTHTQGIAADIRVNNGAERFILLNYAFEMSFSGIGVAKTFIHVDIRNSNPVVWLY